MTSIKNKEQKFFDDFVGLFLEKKKWYDTLFAESDLEQLVELKFYRNFENYDLAYNKISYRVSSSFLPLAKNVVNVIQNPIMNKLSFILQKVVDENIIHLLRLDDSKYVQKILNFFAQKCLEVEQFLEKYSLDVSFFLKEYFIACFLSILLLPFGKVKHLELFDLITRIWIIFDNMCDGQYLEKEKNKKWKKEVIGFFKDGIYRNKSKRDNYVAKYLDNPVLECCHQINSLNLPFEDYIYKKFYKLFKFSYITRKEDCNTPKEIIAFSTLKARKCFDIYINTLEEAEKYWFLRNEEWDLGFIYKYYDLSLGIQLLDDFLDMRKDLEEKNNTIFTDCEKRERLSILMMVQDIFDLHGGKNKYFYNMVILFAMEYNAQYLPDGIREIMVKKTDFLNMNAYNGEILFNLLEDPLFVTNLSRTYLFENKMDFADVTMDKIAEELEEIVNIK